VRTILLSILLAVALAACQSAIAPAAQGSPATGLTTEAARASVRRYLSTQSDSVVYLLKSAVIQDEGRRWAVWMPRSDRATVKPAGAAFTVDKKTGVVARVPLK